LRTLDAAIEWVEPNYIVRRAAVRSPGVRSPGVRSPGFSRKRGQAARRKTTPGPETLVALIDTGIDRNHPDLRHFLSSEDGWNFIDDDGNLADDNGHGTQVAGIIQSNSQSQIRLLPLKALDRSGDGTIAEVVEAFDHAIAKHAAVINCSFGTQAYSRALLDAVKRAETAGIVVVAAAGMAAATYRNRPSIPQAIARAT
jgi:subtilisin family serine protease